MRAANVMKSLEQGFRINKPTMLWGPPGIGKSSLYKQLAKMLGVPLIDWRLTIMDGVDMRGTPREKNGRTYWAPPVELPDSGRGILLLDELPQAKMEVKNVAAMLVLERRISEYKVPEGWWICAAGNEVEHNAGATPLPKQLENRFWHLTMNLSHADWLTWAEANDIDFRVYAYIKYRPEALLEFDPRSKTHAFATPRSWELLSDLIKDLDSNGGMSTSIDPELRGEQFSGAVGTVRGTEFSGFLQVMDSLVDIDDVYARPDKAALPTDPSVCYALAVSLAMHAKRETMPAAARYIERLPQEFAVVMMHAVEKHVPALMKSKAYVEMAAKYQAML